MTKKFGMLKIVQRNKKRVICLCDCGVEKDFDYANVISGRTKSCGCNRIKSMSDKKIVHGENKRSGRTKEHIIWHGIVGRCVNKGNTSFPRYGGRGIKVCKRWRTYKNFLADMGRCPSKDHSIDRINNDGDYKSSNCRWVSRTENMGNRRNTFFLNVRGKKISLADFCSKHDVSYPALHARLKRGFVTIEDVICEKQLSV